MKKRLLATVAFCLGPFACGGSDGPAEDDLTGRVGAAQVSTTEPGIRLLSGYNSLFDTQKNGCVKAVTATPALVGQPTAQTTIRQIQNDTELSKELGIDVAVSVKVPTVSVQASTNFAKSYKNSTSTLYYLIQATQSYSVSQNGDVLLQDGPLSDFSQRRDSFFMKCGDRFISSVTFQARIFALVTFRTTSVERANSLQASISGSGNFGVVAVDASVKSRLSRASKETGVETTVNVIANGFNVSSSDPLLRFSGTIDQKLKRIDELGSAMAQSIADDRARDTRDYANNNLRNAIPVGVSLASYGVATNAPAGSTTVFAKQQDTLRKVETYIRTLSQLRHRMHRAYIDEISTFLDESDEGKAGYNLLSPAKPARYSSELVPIAQAWAARFRPDDTDGVGTDVEPLSAVLAKCVDHAKEGDYTNCGQSAAATSLREYTTGTNALQSYAATGRVGKLRFYAIERGAGHSFTDAVAFCKNNGSWNDRLPTPDEAVRLAPLVADYGGGSTKTIWTGDTPSCAATQGQGMPSYTNPLDPGTLPSFACAKPVDLFTKRQAIVCVPQSGPIGTRPAL